MKKVILFLQRLNYYTMNLWEFQDKFSYKNITGIQEAAIVSPLNVS
ncbi:hypothetical protein G3A_04230 [Bacillus sp. 17376]|nr:hypothetical protein G3A_04230 [Bacillus sp. 17376]